MLLLKRLSKCAFAIAVIVSLSLPVRLVGQSLTRIMADALYEQGELQYRENQRERFLAAIASWQQALKLYRELADLRSEGQTLLSLGDAYRSLGEYDRAIDYYRQSIALEVPDRSIESYASIHLGYVYWLLGEYKVSIQHSERGLITAKEIENNLLETVALNNLGSAYKSICQYDRARDYHDRSLNLAINIEYPKGQADALGNLGNLYQALNKPLEALASHEQNLELARAMDDRSAEANALGNLGWAYYALADYPKAKQYHQRYLELARELGDLQGEARAIGNLGSVYYRYGQYTKAIKNYQQYLNRATQMNDRQGKVIALSGLGNNYNALGQPLEAMKYLQQAWENAKEIGDCRSESATLNGLGLSLQDLGGYERAINYFEQSLELAEKYKDERGKGHVVGNLGSTYLEWGTRDKKPEYFRRAIEYYLQKLEIVRKNKDFRSEGAVLTNMGVAYTKSGDYETAADSFSQARQILLKIGDRDAYGQAIAGTAFLHQQRGETERAIALYREAIEITENIRSQLMVGAFKSSFEERQVNTYERIIELLWDRGDKREAFSYVERGRAKTFLDRLADGQINFHSQAEPELLERERELQIARIAKRNESIALKNHDEDEQDTKAIAKVEEELIDIEQEYTNLLTQIELQHSEVASLVSLQPRKLLSLAQIQQKLDDETTLVEYFVTPERTFAFVITRYSFDSVELEVKENQFQEGLEKLRQFADIELDLHPDALQKFYEWSIAPLQTHLSSSKNLIIVPHGILHYLPFAALTDGSKYLIDTYNVATLPSANVLNFLNGNETARKTSTPSKSVIEAFLAKLKDLKNYLLGDRTLSKILILGNPVTSMPDLKNAAKEAQAIAKLYQTQAFLEQKATERVLRSQVEESEIVHLAAHGEYNNRNPLFSTIHLAQDEREQYDGRLEVHEVYGLNLARAKLVVLSACETNIGDLSKGDELVGLNRAFIYAQTPTVIASLWSVDDEPTSLLMEQFYTYLRRGMNKAQALRQAQQVVRKIYPHPYFWAAFSLTGDGGKL